MRPAIVIALAAFACLLPGRPAHAATAEEAGVVAGINKVRADQGLRPLELHPELERKADDWAAHLADIDSLVHSRLSDGITVAWSALAENLAAASTVDKAEELLLASPGHYANIVDARMTHVGVGIVADGGQIYLVEEFMQLPSTSPATQPKPAPATMTAPAPAPVAPAPAPAPTATRAPRPAPAPSKPKAITPSASPATAPPATAAPAPAPLAPPAPVEVEPATSNTVEAVSPAATELPTPPTVEASVNRPDPAGKFALPAGTWVLGALTPVGVSRILRRGRRLRLGLAANG